jgi:hypothetical protein
VAPSRSSAQEGRERRLFIPSKTTRTWPRPVSRTDQQTRPDASRLQSMFPTELAGASAAAFHPESNTVDLPLPISLPILAQHLGRRVVTRGTTPFSLQLGQCLTPNGKTKGPFEAKLEARTLIADRDVRLSRSRRRHGPLLSDREIISLETRYLDCAFRYLTRQSNSARQER